jgi:hypothetical protein
MKMSSTLSDLLRPVRALDRRLHSTRAPQSLEGISGINFPISRLKQEFNPELPNAWILGRSYQTEGRINSVALRTTPGWSASTSAGSVTIPETQLNCQTNWKLPAPTRQRELFTIISIVK